MTAHRSHTFLRGLSLVALGVVMVFTLRALEAGRRNQAHQERLYFPSGSFLVESSLGFREAAADFLWFRFVQYYGAHAKGENDLRYFDVLIDGVMKLDPRFVEAYHFASLVRWSSLGDVPGSFNILRRGILANPDSAKLKFQVGFMYYVLQHDYERAAHWFEVASECSDATDKEARFAAFARQKAGDDRVSLALWKNLYETTDSPQMKELAEKMITKLVRRLEIRKIYGDDFIGPIPAEI